MDSVRDAISLLSYFVLPLILVGFPLYGVIKRVPVYESFVEGARDGFRPWEKTGLMAAFLLPLVSRMLATGLAIPLGPPVTALLFVLVLRRVWDAPQAPRRRWASAAQDAEPIGPSSS